MGVQLGNLSIVGYPEERKICIDFRYDTTGRKMSETTEHWEIKSAPLGTFHIISIQKNLGKEICSKDKVISFTDLGRELGVSIASLVIHVLHVNY